MTGYRLSETALEQIRSIWSQIARDSRQGADRVVDRIIASCDHLGTFHVEADPWPGQPAGLRYYPVSRTRYVIAFVPATDPLQIVAVIDGTRNLPRISLR